MDESITFDDFCEIWNNIAEILHIDSHRMRPDDKLIDYSTHSKISIFSDIDLFELTHNPEGTVTLRDIVIELWKGKAKDRGRKAVGCGEARTASVEKPTLRKSQWKELAESEISANGAIMRRALASVVPAGEVTGVPQPAEDRFAAGRAGITAEGAASLVPFLDYYKNRGDRVKSKAPVKAGKE